LLDTNSIIYALNCGFSFPKHSYIFSIITEIELLSFSELTKEESKLIIKALNNFQNINITNDIKVKTIDIRKHRKIKLPDSLIIATALNENAILVTSDKQLLNLDIIETIELKELK
ncbi:MAG: PIN domain-containing protein, partial [Patescibacteria group bacterium]|nr:PIN domain-containing protein [Patescibacteria group bacterium]